MALATRNTVLKVKQDTRLRQLLADMNVALPDFPTGQPFSDFVRK